MLRLSSVSTHLIFSSASTFRRCYAAYISSVSSGRLLLEVSRGDGCNLGHVPTRIDCGKLKEESQRPAVLNDAVAKYRSSENMVNR